MESKALQAKYAGLVPCAVLELSDPEAMLVTVRINRAKGVHVALRMSDLVTTLLGKYGYTVEQIAHGIGASVKEVELLKTPDVFEYRKLKDAPYSKAWVPGAERGHQGGDSVT